MPGIQLIYHPSEPSEEIRIALPYSKSMAARAIIIAASAGLRASDIPCLPDCSDTEELLHAINRLPAGGILKASDKTITSESFNLGSGGTSMRFFTALAASWPGLEARISCSDMLMRRPMSPLCSALIQAGASIESDGKEGYPPFVTSGTLLKGGEISVSASMSSQFCSAMMLSAPFWTEGFRTSPVSPAMVSFPYIRMTAMMMERAGAEVEATPGYISVKPEHYTLTANDLHLIAPEADWSAAAFFYAFALIQPDRPVRFSELTPPPDSLQGDSRCAEIFEFAGVSTVFDKGGAIIKGDRQKRDMMAELSKITPLEFDMTETPDLVPPVVVALCLSGIRFIMHGVDHLRHKESDRLEVLRLELEKIGYSLIVPPVSETDKFLRYNERIPYIEDQTRNSSANTLALAWLGRHVPVGENETIDPHDDHRIAMALSLAALRRPYISIKNPECVNKSYPGFFSVLTEAGIKIEPFGIKAARNRKAGEHKRSWHHQLAESDRRLAEAARRQGLLTPEGEPIINRALTSRHKSMKQFARELRKRGMRPPKAITPPARLRPGHPTI